MRIALDEVLEFAHVAGPVVASEGLQSVFGNFHARAAVLAAELREKLARQQRNVLLAFAQRRNEERHHVEPVEKIFAKVALGNLLFKVFVGRRDQPHVHAQWLRAAHGRKHPSSSALSTLACVFRLMSPTSSRKSVPPSARSECRAGQYSRPGDRPGNAPGVRRENPE